MPVRDPTLGTIQLCRESLTSIAVKDICFSLNNHGLRTFSLRECTLEDKDFKKLMLSVGKCKSIAQLCLNVGIINNSDHVDMLSKALMKNKSLTTLFIHGSKLTDSDILVLVKALASHPKIKSLDFGDCKIGDYAIEKICDLLPPDGIKPGLEELSLSGNPAVTSKGWAKLGIAIAASSCLKSLYLDYNALGNYGAGVIAVATAGNSALEVIDLECTGITDHGAKVFLHLLQSFPNKLKILNVAGNKIKEEIVEQIASAVERNSNDISDAIRKERFRNKEKLSSDTDDDSARRESSQDNEEPEEIEPKSKSDIELESDINSDTKIKEYKNKKVQRHESVKSVKSNTGQNTYDQEQMDLLAIAHELEKQRDSDEDVTPESTQKVEAVPRLQLGNESDDDDYEVSDEDESTEDETEDDEDTYITDAKDLSKLRDKISSKINDDKSEKEEEIVKEKYEGVEEYTAKLSEMEADEDDEYDSDEAEFMTEIPVTNPSRVPVIPSQIATADGSYTFHCSRYF